MSQKREKRMRKMEQQLMELQAGMSRCNQAVTRLDERINKAHQRMDRMQRTIKANAPAPAEEKAAPWWRRLFRRPAREHGHDKVGRN